MPELPEVEVTRRALEPYLVGQRIDKVEVYEPRLRWLMDPEFAQKVRGQRILRVTRRNKYLQIRTESGMVWIHLGMSGTLRWAQPESILLKHEHVRFCLHNGGELRYRDPRRFGSLVWSPSDHPDALITRLTSSLGFEPWDDALSGKWLYQQTRMHQQSIKMWILSNKAIVGVGNIYACESLFRAGIHPERPCHRVSQKRYDKWLEAVRSILLEAIEKGGSTLKDFTNPEGGGGYFQRDLQCYGRQGEPCVVCQTPIVRIQQGQRSTWFCPCCQR